MAQIKRPFIFDGVVSSSKSLMNRALISQSFFSDLNITGFSKCEDVQFLMECLNHLKSPSQSYFNCGSGGTTFRFLLARLSREKGKFLVKAHPRLMERPHQPLYESLKHLGVKIEQGPDGVCVESRGWLPAEWIPVDPSVSSQFVSALLLSSWNLDFSLRLKLGSQRASDSYLQMTIEFLKELGMEIEQRDQDIVVPPHQSVKLKEVSIEPDMSSLFSLAAFAVTEGELVVKNFPQQSLQPDSFFVELLIEMGASIFKGGSVLEIETSSLNSTNLDLSNNPDLFPVLAVLLSRIEGTSKLSGLEVLSYKESDRLKNTINLLQSLGFECSADQDQFSIFGKKDHIYPESFDFNPDHDHRMAMAAALAVYQGADIQILNKEVVNKSFPEFWEIIKQ